MTAETPKPSPQTIGSLALAAALRTGGLNIGSDLFGAAVGFSVVAASFLPAQEHEAIKRLPETDFAVEARFLRALARHFNQVAGQYDDMHTMRIRTGAP